jgi:uncharacterized membrane protein YeiH
MDLLGTVVVGSITALGGGTIRDALLLNRPPFWIGEMEYFFIALAASAAAFFGWPWFVRVLWADAVG